MKKRHNKPIKALVLVTMAGLALYGVSVKSGSYQSNPMLFQNQIQMNQQRTMLQAKIAETKQKIARAKNPKEKAQLNIQLMELQDMLKTYQPHSRMTVKS